LREVVGQGNFYWISQLK